MRLDEMISFLEEIQDKQGTYKEVWISSDIRSSLNNIVDIEEFKRSIFWIQPEEQQLSQKDKIMAKWDELLELLKDLK